MNKLILNFKSKDPKKIKSAKNFLGGKGANLSEMGRMGLPVPPGFTISTKVCEIFYKDKKKLNSKLINQIKKELKIIEKEVSKKFGDLKNPLLLSVRSGARVSMPGMMDTILNLGLNDKTVIALSKKTSNGRFAKDSYRRFIQMYGSVVMGVESFHFEELIENYKLTKGVLLDTEMKNKEIEITNTTDPGIFKSEYEKNLYKKINEIKKYYSEINNDENYEQSLSILAGARREVFEFFDNVKVNEENEALRKNRLELINMLCKTFQNFINFQLLKTNNE